MRGDGAATRVISASADGQVNKLEFTGLDGLLHYEINLGNSVATKHLYLGRTKLVDVEGSSVTYYHSDPTGSPLAATAADGSLLWRTCYRPFGEKLAGATKKNQQWFTGKPFEDKIGLSYFGARWYDPVLGRFMAIDPVDWVGSNPVHSFNRYAYANNNPLRFVDPDGRVVAQAVEVGVVLALGYAWFSMNNKTLISNDSYTALKNKVTQVAVWSIANILESYLTYQRILRGDWFDEDDDENFGGRKSKGFNILPDPDDEDANSSGKGSPRDPQKQNEQTNAAKKKFDLNKKQMDKLHDEISGQGYDFNKVMEIARDIKNGLL